MKIKWYGHSCFLITSDKGVRIVTDPFAEGIGYDEPNIEADIVTVSHSHYDHNKVEVLKGNFNVLDKPGNYKKKGIQIKGIPSSHGHILGKNVIFKYIIDNIHVCHLGDLGTLLNKNQIHEIGKVDVLIIPIGGGGMVLSPKNAIKVINQLGPNTIIPMHYKTKALSKRFFLLKNEKKFIKYIDTVHKNTREIDINKGNLKDFKGNVLLKYA